MVGMAGPLRGGPEVKELSGTGGAGEHDRARDVGRCYESLALRERRASFGSMASVEGQQWFAATDGLASGPDTWNEILDNLIL